MRVHCVNSIEGVEVWNFPASGDVDSSPVIAGGQVIFGGDDGRVRVVNLEDGKLLWSYEIGAAIKTAPAVLRGMILLGADDGCVYAFRGKRAELQKSEVRIQ
jgi:outer membrane protein assembly factor BamB